MRLGLPQPWSARAVTRLVLQHAGLLGVLGVALAERLALLRWWKAFPGGDTYNFILIAQELLRGSYPVAEKRLPVYPLLLLLVRPFTDWETAAVVVAIVSSLAAIALLYALGRTLGLSKTALVVGLLPFMTITPFLFQSIRGYADTTFVALTLGALLAFLRMRTWRGAALTGFLAALAALTRPEGIVLLPVLAAVRLKEKVSGTFSSRGAPPGAQQKRFLTPFLAAAAVPLLLFALLSLSVGRPLAPREYLTDAEISEFGATSPPLLVRNVWALWQSLGADRLWAVPTGVVKSIAAEPSALGPRLWSFLTDPKQLPAVLILVGLITLLRRSWRQSFPVILAYVALSIPIAWWGVRQRFLVSLTPLPFLVLSAGADALAAGARRIRPMGLIGPIGPIGRIGPMDRLAPSILLAALLLLSFFFWRANNAAEQRELMAKNQGQGYAYYRAVKYAENLSPFAEATGGLTSRIAFDHRSSIALALFGEPDRGRAVFADTHLDARDPSQQWVQFQQWDVRYLVVRNAARDAFPVLDDPAFRDHFSVVERFEHLQARGGLDRAAVYAVSNAGTGAPK